MRSSRTLFLKLPVVKDNIFTPNTFIKYNENYHKNEITAHTKYKSTFLN